MILPSRAVLGIDAAWTPRQPSGVALAVECGGRWRLAAAEASYDHFIARASEHDVAGHPGGSDAEPVALINAATRLCGVRPDLVAVDMPLSHRQPIGGRRPADDAVSRAYGGRQCGTHSPGRERPGEVGRLLQHGFAEAGYPLRTSVAATPGLIEVYPHPALVEMLDAERRLPYKVDRARAYWRGLDAGARRLDLLAEWARITAMLDTRIAGTADALAAEPGLTRRDLKAREDIIDAVVCCAVAVSVLEGAAKAFGCDGAAIWIPLPRAPAT